MTKNASTKSLIPSLLVYNIEETINFYQVLGFKLTGISPSKEQANWIEVRRVDIAMQFYSNPPIGTSKKPICSGTFYIQSTEVNKLAESLKGKIEFEWGPMKTDVGTFEFGVKDPNGYFIAFVQTEA